MRNVVRIKEIENLNYNVKRIVTDKPEGYSFKPGQATHIAVNKESWRQEDRPFTFTSLPEHDDLEFMIKIYPEHHGVTDQVDDLKVGDELLLEEAKGAITYKGPGYFIAGGAGITPFVSIFRDLEAKGTLDGNTLLFANKTDEDVFLEKELNEILNDRVVHVITDQKETEHTSGYIDKDFLKNNITDLTKHFYVCGPKGMTKEVTSTLKEIGAETSELVFEK